ncbi:Acyl-CoA-binding protein isoform A [Glycine soja]|nr:Acyl-CoA-binding protein isoform A [Glycine soja]
MLDIVLKKESTLEASHTHLDMDMDMQEDFEQYAEKAKTLPPTQSNEDLLILYGLYKQATVGPVNTSRPGMFNMRDRAKWDAWKAVEGKSKDEAMGDYIIKVKQLLEAAGLPA